MSEREEDDMSAPAIKRIDKRDNTGLTKEKKDILRNHIGKVSSEIDLGTDLNSIREWWKNENN